MAVLLCRNVVPVLAEIAGPWLLKNSPIAHELSAAVVILVLNVLPEVALLFVVLSGSPVCFTPV
jgi:hypothetical protein